MLWILNEILCILNEILCILNEILCILTEIFWILNEVLWVSDDKFWCSTKYCGSEVKYYGFWWQIVGLRWYNVGLRWNIVGSCAYVGSLMNYFVSPNKDDSDSSPMKFLLLTSITNHTRSSSGKTCYMCIFYRMGLRKVCRGDLTPPPCILFNAECVSLTPWFPV